MAPPLPNTMRMRRAIAVALAVVGSFLGGVEVAESKNRERGGAVALGGRLLMKTRNNQINVGADVGRGFGEGARPGRNVWGGRLPFVWGG